jgi:2-polyprenyl-6-methoxyphenol hydroxylase-like FAD-dependent oxidoreductase
MRVLIVGAGIGGLSAALALRRAGAEVVVFERVRQLTHAGQGLLIPPNAVKALRKIRLDEAVDNVGVPGSSGELRSWRGEVLMRLPLAEVKQRTGEETVGVHRGDLQEALLGALAVVAHEEAPRTEKDLVDLRQEGDEVLVRFADGTIESGDLLVGADGLRSRVRAILHADGEPRYAGFTSWRGIARGFPAKKLPLGRGFETWGPGGLFGCGHIGGESIYWFATRLSPRGGRDGPEGPRSQLLRIFDAWHEPIGELIAGTDEAHILRTDVYDRDPLEGGWGQGRVTLLGDAAHPMTPNLGQGASQAIEDAVVLARYLAPAARGEEDVEGALRRYEGERSERTAQIVRRSRNIGRVSHLQNPLLCRLRDAVLRALPDRAQLRQIEEIVAYDV